MITETNMLDLIGNDNLPLDALGSNHMMATSSSDVVKNTVITERLQIDEEFGPENAQQSSMMFNDMFSSVLQPMPYSSVLVYPDMNYENVPLNNSLNDNNYSSILTNLRLILIKVILIKTIIIKDVCELSLKLKAKVKSNFPLACLH